MIRRLLIFYYELRLDDLELKEHKAQRDLLTDKVPSELIVHYLASLQIKKRILTRKINTLCLYHS